MDHHRHHHNHSHHHEEEERRRREEEERRRHHHQEEERRRIEEEERRRHHHDQPPPLPQPYFPTPSVQHVAHQSPPPAFIHHPPNPTVQHVTHQAPLPTFTHHPPPPSVQHFPHQATPPAFIHHPPPPSGSSPFGQHERTVRIFPKAGQDFSLTVRQGQVLLAKSDHRDPYQHWIKDERYSTKVKDKEGHPSFALVNKATGEAIKHSIGETHPVRLARYNPDYLDESFLWTESKDVGGGFRGIRMVNNIKLNFDAFHGDKDHGGVRDGTTVVLWDWWKGDNELWKIVPY